MAIFLPYVSLLGHRRERGKEEHSVLLEKTSRDAFWGLQQPMAVGGQLLEAMRTVSAGETGVPHEALEVAMWGMGCSVTTHQCNPRQNLQKFPKN